MTLPIITPITSLWLQKDCGFSCDLDSLGYVSLVVRSIILTYTQAVQNTQVTVEDKVWWSYRNNRRNPITTLCLILYISVASVYFALALWLACVVTRQHVNKHVLHFLLLLLPLNLQLKDNKHGNMQTLQWPSQTITFRPCTALHVIRGNVSQINVELSPSVVRCSIAVGSHKTLGAVNGDNRKNVSSG